MGKYFFKTPVLFLVFNRLNTTRKVFEEIRRARPKQLFIAADGPRSIEEKKKTDEVRKYILKNIDWKCKVKVLFRDKNLGCKYAVSGAIDWFFKNVEYGIILEDDCLPSQSFFRFCQEMLEKYKDDKRIMHICGTNISSNLKSKEDYFFATSFNVWGWATWKRAWKKYDLDMKLWPRFKKEGLMRNFSESVIHTFFNKKGMDKVYSKKVNTWDYQWAFSCMVNNSVSIIPRLNLITNIGFDGTGTHTSGGVNHLQLKRNELPFPIKENLEFINSKSYQKEVKSFFEKGKLKRFFLRIFNKK